MLGLIQSRNVRLRLPKDQSRAHEEDPFVLGSKAQLGQCAPTRLIDGTYVDRRGVDAIRRPKLAILDNGPFGTVSELT